MKKKAKLKSIERYLTVLNIPFKKHKSSHLRCMTLNISNTFLSSNCIKKLLDFDGSNIYLQSTGVLTIYIDKN